MTYLAPAAALLSVLALVWGVRDIAIRILAHRAAEQQHNAELERRFSDKLDKIGANLLQQLRDETDRMHTLVGDNARWVITRTGGKESDKLPQHITSAIEDRQRRRALAQGRTA